MNSKSQQAREAIFAKLKAAPVQTKQEELPHWQAWSSDKADERVARLLGCMEASHTEIFRTDSNNLERDLINCIESNQFGSVLFGKMNPYLEAIQASCPNVEAKAYDQPIEGFKTALFENIDASVNVIQAAIADTGTLAVLTGENEPRALSLVPPTHIAILRESDIVPNFSELMQSPFWQQGNWGERPPTNMLLISGPSKTADIQQTLAYGAHGPKRLILFLVKE
ncbi:LutC/YkgG family protein [Enterovibrio paralichthyis]|uniref:LutC/YkgG family protein n=1 Tax=Enterovibrio paralichthyis TaxID=2853805 RepID=UPI001C475D4D|nr:lactate utilization protein C [Enterovibrio paralichthyis]MBV7296744.1 lactate utilization protein C [Enterovibrio paralichthyis]